MFDEASSWWSPQKEELPDSKEMEDSLHKTGEQIAEIRSDPEESKELGDEETIEDEPVRSPWQTEVHYRATDSCTEETSP